MTRLPLELIPLRPAVCREAPVTLDVLVRITPPTPSGPLRRPPLNLGLVLDRSGSMDAARKIDFARQAAVYAVEQLLPVDRVSVTIFDDAVEIIAPSQPAIHKSRLIDMIRRVLPGGSTALHGGWQTGAYQVREHLLPEGLNRVLLLTDGLANVGETNPDAIGTDVKRLSLGGVSTTTMGVGNDYNEDLLEAMARSGDGNYYYIESPRQLADIFQTELHGLMATVGHRVVLGLEPQAGVTVADVLNDLDRDADGRLLLPNLIAGMPVELILRLNVPPQSGTTELLGLRLTWTDARHGEQYQTMTLRLPAVSKAEWDALAAEAQVRERAAVQLAGRYKRQATRALETGDLMGAKHQLDEARQALDGLPSTTMLQEEQSDLALVEERVHQGDYVASAKMAKYQHYRRSHSRPREQT